MVDEDQLESIFTEALEHSPDDRAAFLDRSCGGNAELRRRVTALLRASDDAGSFLEHPPQGLAATIATGQLDTVDEEQGAVALDFLEPCEKEGCIGKLGNYEVVEAVGRGGMGLVLRAYDPKLNRVAAIKVIAPELAANAMAVKRFLREAQAAAAVSHDHVVTIYAINDSHRPPFIVMEFVDGQSLQEKIEARGALEIKEILRIGMQTAAGLSAAHQQGLVHRDIKPANILLENGVERVKITDFGLARAVDDLGITQTGQIAGTPQYMSPEQAQGQPVDERSDLFSLGSVLYTMCTGRAAFRADNAVAVLRRVCDDAPRPIREVNGEIPDWLEAIVAKLLAKEPAERFQSAEEVAELLGQHLAHLQHPTTAPRPPRVRVQSEHWDDDNERTLTSCANVISAVGVLGIVAFAFDVWLANGILRELPTLLAIWLVAGGILSFPLGLLVMLGAHRATRRTSYRWAMIAGYLALLPLNPFSVLFLPATIYCVGQLRRPGVRAGFVKRPPMAAGKPALAIAGRSRLITWPAVLIGVGVLLAVAQVVSISTNYGTLVIESEVEDVQVIIAGGGKEVEVIDTVTGSKLVWLRGGDYSVRLKGDQKNVTLDNHRFGSGVVVKRGLKTIVTVRRKLKESPSQLSSSATFEITELRRFEGHTGTVKSVAISPDGKLAASASGWPFGDKSLRLWNVKTGKELRQFEGHSDQIMCVRFSPDGQRLLSGSADRTARVWDVATGKQIALFPDHEGSVEAVAFLPEGSRVLTGASSTNGKGAVRTWDVESGKVIETLGNDNGKVLAAAVSHDGRRAAIGSGSNVRVWDIESGQELRTVPAINQVECISFSPDGRHIAFVSMSPTHIQVVDAESGAAYRRIYGTEAMRAVAFTPDGRHVVAAGLAGVVHVWNLETEQEVARTTALPEIIWSLAVSAEGDSILTGGGSRRIAAGEFERGDDFAMRLWRLPESVQISAGRPADLRRPQKLTKLHRLAGQPEAVQMIAPTPEGERFVSAGAGKILLWHAKTGEIESRIETGRLNTRALIVSGDGKQCATAGHDGSVNVFDLESGETVLTFTEHAKGRGQIEYMAWSPDGKTIASKSWSADFFSTNVGKAELILWEAATGKVLRRLENATDAQMLAFSPNGRRLVAGAMDNAPKVWDTTDGRLLFELKGHTDKVKAVGFSTDGRHIATGSRDGSARIWDADTGQPVLMLHDGGAEIGSLVILPDGRHIAISSKTSLWLYEIANARLVAQQDDLKLGDKLALAVSADGTLLATAETQAHFEVIKPSTTDIDIWQLPSLD